jgi:hypothetical protein
MGRSWLSESSTRVVFMFWNSKETLRVKDLAQLES